MFKHLVSEVRMQESLWKKRDMWMWSFMVEDFLARDGIASFYPIGSWTKKIIGWLLERETMVKERRKKLNI